MNLIHKSLYCFHRLKFGSLLFFVSGILYANSKNLKSSDPLKTELGKLSYAKFEVIFKKGSETEDAYTRFKKMETIRSKAQDSLERLMSQKRSPELSVRYAELLIQRGRDQEAFALELEMSGSVTEAQKLKKSSKQLMRSGLTMHEKGLGSLNHLSLKAEVYLAMSKTERALGSSSRAYNFASKGLELGRKISNGTRMSLYIAKGDAAFDMANAAEALKSYRDAQALSPEDELERSYLDYKIAWSQFNLKDPKAALASLRRLIDLNKDRFALKQEAIRDFGLMASDLSQSELKDEGGVSAIYQYLKKSADADLAEKAIERMASTFASNGRRQDAVDAMLLIINDNPNDKSNAERALLIVVWEKDLLEKWKLRNRYMWILESFGPHSSWFRGLEHSSQILSKKKIESSIRSYSTGLHKEALEDRSKNSKDEKLMIVAKLYDAQIEVFSDEPRIYFYRAELHAYFEEWSDAGHKYDRYLSLIKLAEADSLTVHDKHTKNDALESSVHAWEKAVTKEPIHLQKLLDASDEFFAQNPKDPRSVKVLYSAAEKSFESKNYAAAMKRLDHIVLNFPKTKSSVDAVNAALDLYNKDNDWVNLATNARKWLEMIKDWAPEESIPKVKKELALILSKTELKACEELSKKTDRHLESALCFESFAKGFPNHEFAPKALYQASELYKKMSRSTAELDALEELVKKYPKSNEAEQAFGVLAAAYEKSFLFHRAAEIYEVLVSRPNLKDRDLFLERLLALLQGIGEREKLEKWIRDPLVKPAMRKQILSADYREMLSRLREEELSKGYLNGDFASAEARGIFIRLDKAFSSGELEFHQELEMRRFRGNLLREKGDLSAADKEWMMGLKAFWANKKRGGLDWESAARLRLDQASFWLIPFESTSLKNNPQKKVELFTKLESWYAEVIGMKSPTVALEALWKSSQLYSNFSRDLAALPETKIQATELSKKAELALNQLSSRAREWKLISPAILAAIDTSHASGQNPRALKAEFPWIKPPIWYSKNSEWESWEEWRDSRDELISQIAKSQDRKHLRRSALVLTLRDSSFANDKVKDWVSTLGDVSSIQVRIQALVQSKSYQLANLYLDQYQELFGKDAFVNFIAGQIMWARGDYASAQDYWVRKNSFDKDFHTVYWKAGWDYAFANLGSAEHKRLGEAYFHKLNALADEPWKKVYVINLCVQDRIACTDSFVERSLKPILTQDLGLLRGWQSVDGDSAFTAKVSTIESYVKNNLSKVKELSQMKIHKDLLPVLWDMGSYSLKNDQIKASHKQLKSIVERRQNEIEFKLKNDLLAGSLKASGVVQ